ncbi:hypothetical protein ABZP36_023965 [Zizania latifolia]
MRRSIDWSIDWSIFYGDPTANSEQYNKLERSERDECESQDVISKLEETLQAVNIVLLQFRAVLFATVPKSSRGVVPSVAGARGLVEKSRVEAEGKKNGQQRSDTEKKIDLLKFIDRTRQHMQEWIFMSCWIPQGDRRKYHDCVSVTCMLGQSNVELYRFLVSYY